MVKARKPIRIGVDAHHIYKDKKGKNIALKYTYLLFAQDHPEIVDGWVSVKKGLPVPFELHSLKILGLNKTKVGWWNGKNWDGLRLSSDDKVTFWNQLKGDHR